MEDPLISVPEVEDPWQVVRSRKGKTHAKRVSPRPADDAHLSCCPGHAPTSVLNSRDAHEEQQRLRVKLQKSLERVRNSVFFKKLVEQMHCLQIFEKLLANATGAASLHSDHLTTKGEFASVGLNSVDHEACAFHFSDGTCAALFRPLYLRHLVLGLKECACEEFLYYTILKTPVFKSCKLESMLVFSCQVNS